MSADETASPGFETLLSACIDCLAEEGESALRRLLGEHPQDATRLRARLRELDRFGLLQRRRPDPERIGGHRILGRLGRGGMGEVYLAEEPGGRRVALKLARLPSDSVGEEDAARQAAARARFEREVRVMALLSHPGLMTIREAGDHEGRPWFTMEHVRGTTLAAIIAALRTRGTPTEALTARDVRAVVAEALERETDGRAADPGEDHEGLWLGSYSSWCCRVVRDVAAALEHAHAHGVLHRDVKPANVLVHADGRVQIFDFGLARLDDQQALTRSDDFAGTPYAVAPEQVDKRRGEVDERTDVWGVGVTLYELLALRRPFSGASTAELLRRILDAEPVPLSRLQPGLPRDLDHVCATLLEKRPVHRYAGAAALRADLERHLEGGRVQARGASPARRLRRYVARRPAQAIAAGLALALVVLVPVGLLAANAAIREQARRAEQAAQESSRQASANAEVVDYLIGLFRPVGYEDALVQDGALAMLETQAQRLELSFADQPLVRAALLEATANVYSNLELQSRALPLYDRALAIRQSQQGGEHPDVVRLLEELARSHLSAGHPASAADLCRRALAALPADPGDGAAIAVRAHTTLARAEADLGDPEAAAGDLLTAIELLCAHPDSDAAALAEVHEAAARVETQLGHDDVALQHGEHALDALLQAWLPDPRLLARILDELSGLRATAGDVQGEAEASRAAGLLHEALRAPGSEPPLAAPLVLETDGRDEFDEAFQGGITALQVRRLDVAVSSFARCLELRPASRVSMYNLACCAAVAGDADTALGWLDRAAEAGFAVPAGKADAMRHDADLASLVGDARFAPLLARLETEGARLRDWMAQPATCVPADLDGAPLPLLVVLHANGSDKGEALEAWRSIADAAGYALLVPSAGVALGSSAESGLAWFEEIEAFARQPWSDEDAVIAALRGYLSTHAVDSRRVVLAGEGSGAVVAFDVALRAPGLVRGVLLVHGPAWLPGLQARAKTAAALGLRAAAVYDPSLPVPWTCPGMPAADYAQALDAWLSQTGLAEHGGVQLASLHGLEGSERTPALVAALRRLSP